MATITITTTVGELGRHLGWVSPAASTDTYTPALCAVFLQWALEDDPLSTPAFDVDLNTTNHTTATVALVATDRYRMHWSSAAWAVAGEGVWDDMTHGQVLLEAKPLAQAMKAHPRRTKATDPQIQLVLEYRQQVQFAGVAWVVDTVGVQLVSEAGTTVVPTVSADFPDWKNLVKHDRTLRNNTVPLSVDPALLLDLSRAAVAVGRYHEPHTLRFGATDTRRSTSPIRFHCGIREDVVEDTFSALLMPKRLK